MVRILKGRSLVDLEAKRCDEPCAELSLWDLKILCHSATNDIEKVYFTNLYINVSSSLTSLHLAGLNKLLLAFALSSAKANSTALS